MGVAAAIDQFDKLLASFFAAWDIYSTAIATVIAVLLGYILFFSKDEDIHPYFLARQASQSPTRRQGESAVFRNLETPNDYPLRSGLDLKEPGAPKWTAGRNGDLRDVWRSAVKGCVGRDGKPTGQRGQMQTVLGTRVMKHDLDDISRHINVIGKKVVEDLEGKTVALSLTNSTELLTALFASAFYGFKAVLLPSNLTAESLAKYLHEVNADTLIAEAGNTDLLVLLKSAHTLRNVIWVVKGGSSDVDWTETPNIGRPIKITAWNGLLEENLSAASQELPENDVAVPQPIISYWAQSPESGVLVEYDQKNVVSAIAAVASALPQSQRIKPDDTVLPVDSLCQPYALSVVLAALFLNASVVLKSVSGDDVDLMLAVNAVSPTIVVASSNAVSRYYREELKPSSNALTKAGCFMQRISLDKGVFPIDSLASRLTPSELSPGLRLLLISQPIDADKGSHLSPQELSDLRCMLKTRVAYALTAPKVFGAVCQTNPYDYRRFARSHFGPPLSSLELKVVDGTPDEDDRVMEGKIFVSGPSVASGTCNLGVQARINPDHTLSLV